MKVLLTRVYEEGDVFIFWTKGTRPYEYFEFDSDTGVVTELGGVPQYCAYANVIDYDCYYNVPLAPLRSNDMVFVDFTRTDDARIRMQMGLAVVDLWGRRLKFDVHIRDNGTCSLFLTRLMKTYNLAFWHSVFLFRRVSDSMVSAWGAQQGMSISAKPFMLELRAENYRLMAPNSAEYILGDYADDFGFECAFVHLDSVEVKDSTGLSVSFTAVPNGGATDIYGYLWFGNCGIPVISPYSKTARVRPLDGDAERLCIVLSDFDLSGICLNLCKERQCGGVVVFRCFFSFSDGSTPHSYSMLYLDLDRKKYSVYIKDVGHIIPSRDMIDKGTVARRVLLIRR